ncbi:MAG: ThuA domain-containing protein [Verrucomicrobiota bacterium]|nr:ThuA domain-containing protein [Limisphaera sp.]MDW8380996.1 ThuA domain-containing protein [Verrucomicrobiota bacterium]
MRKSLAWIWLAIGLHLARAWDYEVHRSIVDLALGALPTNFPAFVHEPMARERLLFLSGEPDRWRNTSADITFSHATAPDHYLDVEDLAPIGLRLHELPLFRYEFAFRVLDARARNPERFDPIPPQRDRDRSQAFPGFLPWTLSECVSRVKSAFAFLHACESYGAYPEETINARENVLYAMGILSHFVGDATQPLHTTRHHHGWVGDNPHAYTTNRGIHAWIDGGYFEQTGGIQVETLRKRLRVAQVREEAVTPDGLFRMLTGWLEEQHRQVEPLYALQKQGKFSGLGVEGIEGRLFLETQVVAAAQMLADLWTTAWAQAPRDTFWERRLQERTAGKTGRLRVLVVTGGHDYDRLPFLALFTGMTNVSFRVVEHPRAHLWFRPERNGQYDVVVLYDMWRTIDPVDREHFVRVTTRGTGVVALHHALAAYPNWEEYARLLGGQYLFHSITRDGQQLPASRYRHDVRFRIRIADPEHPVTRGLTDYEILDETYQDYWVAPDVKPLLLTDEPSSTPIVGWAKTNQLSRWVYIQGGHDRNAWEHPIYRKLVEQAIRWVAGGVSPSGSTRSP